MVIVTVSTGVWLILMSEIKLTTSACQDERSYTFIYFRHSWTETTHCCRSNSLWHFAVWHVWGIRVQCTQCTTTRQGCGHAKRFSKMLVLFTKTYQLEIYQMNKQAGSTKENWCHQQNRKHGNHKERCFLQHVNPCVQTRRFLEYLSGIKSLRADEYNPSNSVLPC